MGADDGDPPSRDAYVLRFPPGGDDPPRKLRYEARANHKRSARELGEDPAACEPRYRLSVFADVARDGEDEAAVLQRLIQVAANAGIRVADAKNAGFWVANAGEIVDANFTFCKDAYPGEPAEHYCVDVGPEEPDNERIQRLLAVFEGPRDTEEGRRQP